MPVASAVEGGCGGGLPSLTNIGHPVYHTPNFHAVASALCASSSLPAAAGAALLQLKQLRVSLEDLQACAYRYAAAAAAAAAVHDIVGNARIPYHSKVQVMPPQVLSERDSAAAVKPSATADCVGMAASAASALDLEWKKGSTAVMERG
jgi:hypothetical protein